MAAQSSSLLSAHQAALPVAREFLTFVNESVTPFHATAAVARMLEKNGYKKILETEVHTLREPNGKYFMTRNGSSIVAVSCGGKYQPGNGLKIVGAHTDSPNLALRPKTIVRKPGHVGVGISLYGGILLHTWFDRSLTVGGRVVLQQGEDKKLVTKLVNLKKPILRVPNLAIHLTSGGERDAFSPHKENNTVPIGATEAFAKAVGQALETPEGNHCGPLFTAIAKELACSPSDIVDFDLSVFDTQEGAITGLYDEFIDSARIDNLASVFCSTKAMIRADENLAEDNMIRMCAFFDHEEVGSSSCPGAGGTLMPDVINRITSGIDASQRVAMIQKCFHLSVDGAHALHPNYSEKHNVEHRPIMNQGPVIKYNANQRYATCGATAAVVKAIAERASVPCQPFCVRNDSPCGSTIGAIVATLTGIKTVDLGVAQLSMHSIREQFGVVDCYYLEKLLCEFFGTKETHLNIEENTA